MKNIFVILALSLPFMVSANSEKLNYSPTRNNIIPPSPEVGELISYSNFTVDNNVGTPNIYFDLFTIKEGDISIPVTINYQSGGIHLDESEGNAGIGWTINMEGCVSRTIYGGPDDHSKGPRSYHGLFYMTDEEYKFRNELRYKKADYDPADFHKYMKLRSWQTSLGLSYFENKCDLANDIFHLNGLGFNATFAYDDDHKLNIATESPIRLEPTIVHAAYPLEFTVKHLNGLVYKYGERETTKYVHYTGAPFLEMMADTIYYTSSWHISQIKDLMGNTVNFSYEDVKSYILKYSRFESVTEMTNENFEVFNTNPVYTTPSEITYFPKTLRQISTSGYTVDIDYETDSVFHYRKKRITAISIKSLDNEVLKKYTFEYQKFSSDINHNWHFLKKIRLNGEVLYAFDYNLEVPHKEYYMGSSVDFGGYFNGKKNGLIVPSYSTFKGGLADRSVDPNLCIFGTLKSITYPTGGKTKFDWESNEYAFVGNVPIKHHINGSVVKTTTTDTLRMSFLPELKKTIITGYRVNEGQEIFLDLSKYFLFNPDLLFNTDYYRWHDDNLNNYSFFVPTDYPHVRVYEANTRNVLHAYYLDYNTIEKNGKKEPIYIPLPVGSYDIELVNPTFVDQIEDYLDDEFHKADCESGKVYIIRKSYANSAGKDVNKDYWCGLRLKRITSSPSENEEPIIKDYFYTKAFDPNYSNGVVQMLPTFHNTYYMGGPALSSGLGEEASEVVTIGSSAFAQTPMGPMSSVEYPTITTRLSLPDRYEPSTYLNNCVEEYNYAVGNDYDTMDYQKTEFINCQPVSSRMYISNAHKRGMLMSKRVGGMNPSTGDVTKYEYNIYDEPYRTWRLTTEPFIVSDFSHCVVSTDGGRDYSIGQYMIKSYNKNIASQTVTEESGFTRQLKYEYFYDSYTSDFDSGLVKSVSSENSEGEKETTYYTYEYIGGLVSDKVETEIKVCGDKLVSAIRNEYDQNSGRLIKTYTLSDNNINAADLISKYKYASQYTVDAISKPEYEYKYNNKGNLVEIIQNGKTLASYIWGYFGQYPVLEVKNVPLEKVLSKITSAGYDKETVLNGDMYNKNSIDKLFELLCKSMKDQEINSYTYHRFIGLMEVTDNRGVKNCFTYDNLGRLDSSKNMNKKIIEKYLYNAKSIF